MVLNVLDAMRLLCQGVDAFDRRCARGFTVDRSKNAANAKTIILLLTELMHERGYATVSSICQNAGGDSERLRRMVEEEL